jgi:hypothetical protein
MKKILFLVTIFLTKIFTVRIEFPGTRIDKSNYVLTLSNGENYPLTYEIKDNDKVLYTNQVLIPSNEFDINNENYLLLPVKKGNKIKEKLISFNDVNQFLVKFNEMFQQFSKIPTDPINLPKLTISDVLDHRPWRKVAQLFAVKFGLNENDLIESYFTDKFSSSKLTDEQKFLVLLQKALFEKIKTTEFNGYDTKLQYKLSEALSKLMIFTKMADGLPGSKTLSEVFNLFPKDTQRMLLQDMIENFLESKSFTLLLSFFSNSVSDNILKFLMACTKNSQCHLKINFDLTPLFFKLIENPKLEYSENFNTGLECDGAQALTNCPLGGRTNNAPFKFLLEFANRVNSQD